MAQFFALFLDHANDNDVLYEVFSFLASYLPIVLGKCTEESSVTNVLGEYGTSRRNELVLRAVKNWWIQGSCTACC